MNIEPQQIQVCDETSLLVDAYPHVLFFLGMIHHFYRHTIRACMFEQNTPWSDNPDWSFSFFPPRSLPSQKDFAQTTRAKVAQGLQYFSTQIWLEKVLVVCLVVWSSVNCGMDGVPTWRTPKGRVMIACWQCRVDPALVVIEQPPSFHFMHTTSSLSLTFNEKVKGAIKNYCASLTVSSFKFSASLLMKPSSPPGT